jgi:outer membrane protein assembly factor BamA
LLFFCSFSQLHAQSDSVLVNNIVIECHKITKDRIILRELAIKKGDVIHRKDLKLILERERNKIFNTGLFIRTDVNANEFEKGKVDVLIHLEELWYIFPFPILEISDRNFSEWWTTYNHALSRVDYGVKFRDINFRGRREDLRLVLQLGFTRKFDLDYAIPYINQKQTIGLGFKMSYSENKSIAYQTSGNKLSFVSSDKVILQRTNFSASMAIRSKFYARHIIGAGYEGNHIADTIAELNKYYFLDSSTTFNLIKADYSFTHDERDNGAYPLKGFFISGGVSFKYVLQPKNIILGSVNVAGLKFFQLSKRWYYGTGIMAKFSTPNQQPYPNMRALGYGRETMRGYELNVIEGRHFVLSKNTLRWRAFTTKTNFDWIPIKQFASIPIDCYLKTYFDVAYVNNQFVRDEKDQLSNRPIFSTGLGIDFVTAYAMAYRFEYSFNSIGGHGFFFNLKTEF